MKLVLSWYNFSFQAPVTFDDIICTCFRRNGCCWVSSRRRSVVLTGWWHPRVWVHFPPPEWVWIGIPKCIQLWHTWEFYGILPFFSRHLYTIYICSVPFLTYLTYLFYLVMITHTLSLNWPRELGKIGLHHAASGYPKLPDGKPYLCYVGLQGEFCCPQDTR